MKVKIADKLVGDGQPVFFIAEAGVNHNGSIDFAKKLIDVAKKAGADAVKFQTFKAEELNTKIAPKAQYHIDTTGKDADQSWFDLLKSQEISNEMHLKIIEHCKDVGIIFLSTPYGIEGATLLRDLNVPAFKIASTDLNNIPLIRTISLMGKPIILSTAMSEMAEIEQSVYEIKQNGITDLILMQCTGNYPAELSNSNLRVMKTFRDTFNCLVGFSDHTLEFINPVAATALGACMIEKHFTLDKTLPGPDHRMSLSPVELDETVRLIRATESALGIGQKYVLESEIDNRKKLRKSIVAESDIFAGDIVTESMLSIKRPANGLPPSAIYSLYGKTAKVNIKKDTLVSMSDFF